LALIKKKYQRKVTDVTTLHYINLDGIKITVFSPCEVMVNELLSIGINPMGKTIKELQIEVSEIFIEHYMDCHYGKRYIAGNTENNRIDRYNQKRVIIHHLKELSYWLYDYNAKKMPKNIKFDFELHRKHNTT
jgi:hypothetical protein